MEIITFKKKKMKLLKNEKHKSYQNTKACYIYQVKFEDKHADDKKYHKVRDHWYYTGEYRGSAHTIHNLKHNVLKKISTFFHNGSSYDYHFIVKELAEEFLENYLFRRKY